MIQKLQTRQLLFLIMLLLMTAFAKLVKGDIPGDRNIKLLKGKRESCSIVRK